MALLAVPRKHIVNLVSLTSVQAANAALPLLVFPFALAVLGEGPYAQIAMAEALAIVVLTVVIYGFDIDGVARVVGLEPDKDQDALSHAFSAVLYTRLLLFVLATPPVIGAAWLLDTRLVPLTLSWLLVPLSYAIQANWFFQGIERNAPVAAFTVVSRVVAVVIVVLSVRRPEDYANVPLIIGVAYLVSAGVSLLYLLVCFRMRMVAVRGATLRDLLWSGKEIFASNLCVILYRDVNVLILGFLGAGSAAVAAYSMAEKIVKGIQASMRPLNQLVLPAALRIAQAARRPGPRVLKSLLGLSWPQIAVQVVIYALLGGVYLMYRADAALLGNVEHAERIAVLVGIMNLTSVVGVVNFMLGWAGLNAMGERGRMLRAIAAAAVASLSFCAMLFPALHERAAALSFVFAEIVLMCMVLYAYLSNGVKTAS